MTNLRIPHGYWYLATVYSKHAEGTDYAFVEAAKAAGNLLKKEVYTYCPIAMTHPMATYANMDRYSYDTFMPLDEVFMRHAHGCLVLMQPGWETSYGVQQEIAYFTKRKRPIAYINPVTLEEEWPACSV